MTEKKKPTRMLFIDNLRILLTILVIMHHTMIVYGAEGNWYFVDPNTDELTFTLLTLLTVINQAFFMGLFFFISTYFVPGSYNRKGARKFLKDRFIRLGIPIVIYIAIVDPILEYIISAENGTSFLVFYLSYFTSIEGIGEFLGGNGPLWFIVTLLIFAIFYCLWRQISKEDSEKEIEQKPLSNLMIILIIIIMSGLTFLVRIFFPSGTEILNFQLGNFVQYIIMLILGVIAYRRDWFRNLTDSQGKMWLAIALLSFPILIVIAFIGGIFETGDFSAFQGGFSWQQLAYATWESIFCMGMSIGLITLFRKKFNSQGKASKTLSSNAYTMYLIHAPVIVVISVLFVVVLIFALLKFVIVLAIVLLLCFLISHLILMRIPGTKRVLG